jgi:LPS-assembly protein
MVVIGFGKPLEVRRMPRLVPHLWLLMACVLIAANAAAQTTLSGFETTSDNQERLNENHWKLRGGVELNDQKDTKLYADDVEMFVDQDRAIATGNVLLTQGNNRISADRADFNTKTRLGTFYNASGIAAIQPPKRSPTTPGAFAPPLNNTDTDVYFFGDVIEKIGAKKYKITNGGFSTCVQPTPRWDLHADTVVLNIDHYTLLRNAILNVKGVPLLYVPVMYYPTKEDDRATGILIPTYGTSSLRGQSIHNAFFWAINRSQDATFMHDWYSRAGQGFGSEYRYNFGGGSDGEVSGNLLNQTATFNADGSGLPQTRAFELRGSANQALPHNLRLRARVNYFSDLSVMQTFNTNVYDVSRNQRSYAGNIVGAWKTFSLNGTYDYNEYFTSQSTSGVVGNSPRITLARNERPLFGANSPIYFSANTEFVHEDRQTKQDNVVIDDSGVSRFDFSPQIRYPFKKWQWFTVNSSVSWRDTYYTRSQIIDPATLVRTGVSDESINRTYYTVQAQAVGPVFNRIFNTPDNGYAERFKHTVEPFLTVQHTSPINDFARIIQIDGVDTIVGGTTNFSYGINNRIYAKRRSRTGTVSSAQEILSIELVQTYYTQALAAQYDPRYTTSFSGAQANNFSPVSLSVRATPSTNVNATVRGEIDSKTRELRTLSANTTYNWSGRLQSTVGWTKRFFIEGLTGFNDPQSLDNSLNVSTNLHTSDNRVGTVYAFNYDILRSGMTQQRISAFYNAQCCGIAFEYQTYNYAGLNSIFPADHRFFLSFSLAGLGNFSPFNGAMGTVPH